MKKKKIEFRKFLYRCTLIMLFFGVISTVAVVKSDFADSRERELIQKAKNIQPFHNAEKTLQDGLRAFFGTVGEWSVNDEYIHVIIAREYWTPFHMSVTFDIPKNFTEFDSTKDEELWIFENVWIDGEEQSPEEIHEFINTIILVAMDYKSKQES